MKSTSRCSERIALTRDRPDERVRRRAHAAGQHDRQVGPRLARCRTFGDLDRVGDDGQVRDCREVMREAPGRRACGEPDRLTGLDEPRRRARDRLLLARAAGATSPRSPAPPRSGRRAASRRRAPSRRSPAAASTSMSRRIVISETARRLGELAHAHAALDGGSRRRSASGVGRQASIPGVVRFGQYSTLTNARVKQIPGRSVANVRFLHADCRLTALTKASEHAMFPLSRS